MMGNRKRRTVAVFAAALVAALAAVLGACGGGSGGGAQASGGEGEGVTVGFSMSFLSSPFFAVLDNLTQQAARDGNLEMLQTTDADQDPGKQISDVQNLVNQGAEGLLVVPYDSNAIVPALEFAEGQNVPVVSMDVGPAEGKVAMTVRADNLGMARTACEAMGKELNGEGKILELQGNLTNINGRDRTDGFEDCMSEQFPNIEVIAEQTNWEPEKAANASQTVLTANPDLDGIYMQSDTIMLPGVLESLKRAGMLHKVGEKGHVYLIGIDGGPLGLEKIRTGEMDALVSQPQDLYAKYGVQYLKQAMAGKTFKTGPTDHDSRIIMFNGNPMDLLPAPLVTKENVDDKTLWGNQPAATE